MVSNKLLKEAFVSNNLGSSAIEVVLITVVPSAIGFDLYQSLLPHTASHLQKLLLEATLILAPLIISQCSQSLPDLHSFLLLLALLYIPLRFLLFSSKAKPTSHQSASHATPTTSLIHQYRSSISLLTFIAILAVDFTAFPRRYCKTEESGYGLMDLGTGSFTIAAGLTSRYARNLPSSTTITLSKILVKNAPTIILGLIRLLTTKGLEYQEHVSEYGVHWNFFFTLSALNISVSLLQMIALPRNVVRVGTVVLVGLYQGALEGGLQEYILHSPRTSDSLLSQNREGVFGVIGYLGVFVAAEEIGRWCIWTPATSGARVSNLFKATVILWLCVFIVVGGGGVLVSRRSTNLAYAVWSLGVNCTLLLGLACVLALHGNLAVASPGFQAVNKNGLLVFVVANLLTGAVNLGVDTMEVGEGGACCVVGVYIALVVMFGLGVDAFKNRVKE